MFKSFLVQEKQIINFNATINHIEFEKLLQTKDSDYIKKKKLNENVFIHFWKKKIINFELC